MTGASYQSLFSPQIAIDYASYPAHKSGNFFYLDGSFAGVSTPKHPLSRLEVEHHE